MSDQTFAVVPKAETFFDAGGREFIISQVLQIAGVVIIAYTIAFKLHRKLASLKNILSPATLKARKQFFIALLLQFTIPSMFLVTPPLAALTLIFFQYEYAHLLSNYIMPIIALHSAFNALIVMFVITPYRLTLIRWFRYIFRIKQSPVISLQPSLFSSSLTQHIEGQRIIYVSFRVFEYYIFFEIEIVGDEKEDEIGRKLKPAPPMRQRSRKISDVSAQDFS
uniref:G protein-coupled receptor n=1 Tax=Panagrolaimus sp. PS1159 TaxID=55785 RepID=A0AC35GK22_9BILA